MAWESGSNPVIILTKADLCDDVAERVAEVEWISQGVPVHVVSSVRHQGLDSLETYLQKGHTIALLGSSGVGKSTLINCLIGEEAQRVREIREEDDRGRHTTTHRELLLLPNGALVIDTPGMRELQIWEADEGLKSTYDDIEELASQCQFNDCMHETEPGCAVSKAIMAGTLQPDRLKNYSKMQVEYARMALKKLGHIEAVEREKGKRYAQILKREQNQRQQRRNRR